MNELGLKKQCTLPAMNLLSPHTGHNLVNVLWCILLQIRKQYQSNDYTRACNETYRFNAQPVRHLKMSSVLFSQRSVPNVDNTVIIVAVYQPQQSSTDVCLCVCL